MKTNNGSLNIDFYKKILDNIKDAIAVVDFNFRYQYTNAAYREIFELPGSINDLPINNHLNKKQIQDVLRNLDEVIKQKKEVNYILSIKNKIIAFCNYPLQANLDKVELILLKAQRLTNNNKQQFNFLDNRKDAVLVINNNYQIEYVNQLVSELFNISIKKLINNKCYSALYQKEEPDEKCPFCKSLKHKKTEFNEYYDKKLKKWMRVISTPLFDNNNNVIKTVNTIQNISQQKKFSDSLIINDEKYHLTIKNSPDAILTWSYDQLISVSPSFYSITNYNKNELNISKQADFLDLVHESDKEMIKEQYIEERKIKKEHAKYKYRLKCKSGKYLWVEHYTTIKYDITGNESLSVHIIREIDDIIKAEQALQKSEERFRLLINNQGEGVAIHDVDEKCVFANPAAEKIFGVNSGNLIGTFLGDFVDIATLKKIKTETAKRKNGINSSYEINIRQKTGKQIPVLVTATPQFDEKGVYKGAFAVFRDISQLNETKKALIDTVEKFKLLFNNMLHGSIYCELIYNQNKPVDFKYLDINASYERIHNINREDIIGKKASEIFETENKSLIQKYIKVGITGRNLHHKYYLKASNQYIEESVFCPKKGFFAAVMLDVSKKVEIENALKEKTEHLKHLNQIKDQLFSIISHDLKNPLNQILGFSQLLAQNYKRYDENKLKKFIDYIYQSTSSLTDLLENLLTWSRSQRNKLTINPSNLYLGVIVENIIELVSISAVNKKIELINNVPYDAKVYADSDMVATIIRNLVSNAIKYTDSGGKVSIFIKKNDDTLIISIKDTGTGIPEAELSELFTLKKTRSKPGTQGEIGTGLGLLLCKEFAEKNKGQIKVESTLGVGTTFHVYLPIFEWKPD